MSVYLTIGSMERKEEEGCQSLEEDVSFWKQTEGSRKADVQLHLFHHKFALG